MMRIKRSIERKVFISLGGLTLLVALSFSLVSLLAAFSIEDSILEKILAHEANVLLESYQQGNLQPTARLEYMTFYADLSAAPKDIVEAKLKNPQTTEVFSDANHHYHIVDLKTQGQQIGWLVADVTNFLSVSSHSSNLLPIAITLLTLAIMFSIWLAYRIALRTTKPISHLARELEKQSNQNSQLDISQFKTGDEIEYLASTIDSTLRALNASLKRESDFNRDVSHELRTPLTVINNTLTLSQQRELQQSDLKKLTNSANKITRIVKTLLALARSETLPLKHVNLRGVLEDSVLLYEQKLAEKTFEVHVKVAEQVTVLGNPELMMLLFNNLIENALNYASENSLEIVLENKQLSFTNRATSQFVVSSEAMTQPNIRQPDSAGIGQGLYLVSRIATRLGWKITLLNKAGLYKVNFELPDEPGLNQVNIE